jgi:hypothetical protein
MFFLKNVMTIGLLSMCCSAIAVTSLDGVYQWNPTFFLSIHSTSTPAAVVATIYFNEKPTDGSVDFSSLGGARLTVINLDSFELLQGTGSGNVATVSGTRFHRACDVTYSLVFNADTSVTVTLVSISKNALGRANPVNINCNTNLGQVGDVATIKKIL